MDKGMKCYLCQTLMVEEKFSQVFRLLFCGACEKKMNSSYGNIFDEGIQSNDKKVVDNISTMLPQWHGSETKVALLQPNYHQNMVKMMGELFNRKLTEKEKEVETLRSLLNDHKENQANLLELLKLLQNRVQGIVEQEKINKNEFQVVQGYWTKKFIDLEESSTRDLMHLGTKLNEIEQNCIQGIQENEESMLINVKKLQQMFEKRTFVETVNTNNEYTSCKERPSVDNQGMVCTEHPLVVDTPSCCIKVEYNDNTDIANFNLPDVSNVSTVTSMKNESLDYDYRPERDEKMTIVPFVNAPTGVFNREKYVAADDGQTYEVDSTRSSTDGSDDDDDCDIYSSNSCSFADSKQYLSSDLDVNIGSDEENRNPDSYFGDDGEYIDFNLDPYFHCRDRVKTAYCCFDSGQEMLAVSSMYETNANGKLDSHIAIQDVSLDSHVYANPCNKIPIDFSLNVCTGSSKAEESTVLNYADAFVVEEYLPMAVDGTEYKFEVLNDEWSVFRWIIVDFKAKQNNNFELFSPPFQLTDQNREHLYELKLCWHDNNNDKDGISIVFQNCADTTTDEFVNFTKTVILTCEGNGNFRSQIIQLNKSHGQPFLTFAIDDRNPRITTRPELNGNDKLILKHSVTNSGADENSLSVMNTDKNIPVMIDLGVNLDIRSSEKKDINCEYGNQCGNIESPSNIVVKNFLVNDSLFLNCYFTTASVF